MSSALGLLRACAGKNLRTGVRQFAGRRGVRAITTTRFVPQAEVPPTPGAAATGSAALEVDNAQLAYASKTTPELFRAWLVLAICNVNIIVRNSRKLVDTSRAVLGDTITGALLKATFFGHFCAGEDSESIKPTLNMLAQYGVGGILDYAAEADIAAHGGASHDESECDANAAVSLQAIHAASEHKRGFAAIKLTALGKPELLKHISSILLDIRRLFETFTEPDSQVQYMRRTVTPQRFQSSLDTLANRGMDVEALVETADFDEMDRNKDGQIDFVEWLDSLDPRTLATQPLRNYVRTPQLSDTELEQLDNMFERLYRLVEAANDLDVRLMIDAEQTYMQPAIDHIVLHLQRKYNHGKTPVVFNTYQAYLTDAYDRLAVDLERSQREGFTFACKLVRGAYMNQERDIAKKAKVESPVWAEEHETHESYHRCMDELVDHHDHSEFVVASHNERSVCYAVDLMAERGIPATGGGVYFGQLLGMCDNVSFALGAAGYEVFKYVPYGPVFEVVPYLTRRAEENAGVLGAADKERAMIRQELRNRMRKALNL